MAQRAAMVRQVDARRNHATILAKSWIKSSDEDVSCLTLLSCGVAQQVRPLGGNAGCAGSGVMLTARPESGPGNSLFRSSEPTLTQSKKRRLGLSSSTISTETLVVIEG